jgi:hypothetical protein
MTPTNKGGRPHAPRNKAEVIERISCESIGKARPERLRVLYRLLRSFTDAEKAEREVARTAAINAANVLKSADIELRRQEYLRRFAAGPLGQRVLLEQNERLRRRVSELEQALANRGSIPTLTESAGDCACQ